MKKIKKYFPLFIGLVLLLSVAAYGTRAYFSDSTTEQAGIELTLGTVDIEGTTKNWQYNQFGENENNGKLVVNDKTQLASADLGKEANIKNARPGDSFSKEFTFTNMGSLDQKVTFLEDNNSSNYMFNISWETAILNEDGETENVPIKVGNYTILEPKGFVTAKMTVSVNMIDVKQDYNEGTKLNIDSSLKEFIGKSITVEAAQTNTPK